MLSDWRIALLQCILAHKGVLICLLRKVKYDIQIEKYNPTGQKTDYNS